MVKNKETLELIHTSRLGLGLLLAGGVILVLLSLSGVGSIARITAKEGISTFAVAYLMAQFIERIIEPFSELKTSEKKKPEEKLFSDTEEIRELSEKSAPTDNEKKILDKLKAKRVYAIWGLAGFMGMLLSYFTVGLFEVAGIEFNPWESPSATITGHTLDAVLSGVIVGSGTKPLHDLIGYLEKKKEDKEEK